MILLRLIGLLLDVLFLPLRLAQRARGIPEGAFVAITIDGPVVDIASRLRFWQRQARKATALYDVSRIVDHASADPRVRGMIVTIKHMSSGMASAVSLRAELARLRAAGKEVVVHLPMGGGSKETYVATAANKIVVGPSTHLAPLGFLSTHAYVRRALDRAGIEPEIFACGEYKTAGETLARESMSPQQREQLEKIVVEFHEALIAAIAEGRGISTERAQEIVDGAPYSGAAAVEAGVADAALYEDELGSFLGLGKHPTRKLVDADAYLAIRGRPLLRRLLSSPTIAVVPVHGIIAHAGGPFERLATDERIARMVRIARLDRRVAGVVLHVDSPGGSALASDRMHHEIVQLARQKPVVACMANVAASGGYYVSAAAHRIVCEPLTVTGSIGVVGARLAPTALFDRLGIRLETVRRGKRAGLLAPYMPLADDERAALGRELGATYQTFIDVVAHGRKMPAARVEELARGRVYTGKEALSVGLVDRLGGFSEALREVRAMLPAAIRDRAEPRMVRTPMRPMPLLDPPADGEAGKRAALAVAAALVPDRERVLLEIALSGERVAALGPVITT